MREKNERLSRANAAEVRGGHGVIRCGAAHATCAGVRFLRHIEILDV